MIGYQTYCEIKALHSSQHLRASQIARRLSLCPKTVRKWLSKKRYEQPRQPPKLSFLDPYKTAIALEMSFGQCSAKSVYRWLKAAGYRGGYTILNVFIRRLRPPKSSCRNLVLPVQWMLQVMQGKTSCASLLQQIENSGAREDLGLLLQRARKCALRDRNRAVCVLAGLRGIGVPIIARFLMISRRTVAHNLILYRAGGLDRLFGFRTGRIRKSAQPKYKRSRFCDPPFSSQ